MSPKADSEEIQSDAAAKKPVASLRVLLFIKWKLVFLLTNCPRYYLDCVVCQTFFVGFFERLLDIAPPSGGWQARMKVNSGLVETWATPFQSKQHGRA